MRANLRIDSGGSGHLSLDRAAWHSRQIFPKAQKCLGESARGVLGLGARVPRKSSAPMQIHFRTGATQSRTSANFAEAFAFAIAIANFVANVHSQGMSAARTKLSRISFAKAFVFPSEFFHNVDSQLLLRFGG